LSFLGVDKIGLCEFFSILFILYEAVSILKNLLLCGAPIPTKLKTFIEKLLNIMTDELPDVEEKEIVKEE
ncbi:phage holin family protein, partial [Clostridium neonatale]|uniref:phage holin family protein n=1 Tax=Clostridium neonatale TaxID=137838 RepID=UPI00397BF93B